MRGPGIALTAAVGGILLVPAAPLADEPPAPPSAALKAAHTTVRAGAPVRLDSSASRAGSAKIAGHVWDLDGNGSFERDSGPRPKVEFSAPKPGKLTVRVRVVDERGQNGDAKLDLTVVPKPKMENAGGRGPGAGEKLPSEPPDSGRARPPKRPADPRAPLAALSTARVATAPALVAPRALSSRAAKAGRKKPARTRVTAAAAKSVTIKNFKYAPPSVSVHTGDTVTWTNQDQAAHTATANDRSFDTGNLAKGKSGSHTFSKSGTFSYICTYHPSMKGTVTVLASGSGGSGSGGGSGGGGSGSSGSGSSSGGSGLPHTGLDIAVVVLIAALMTGAGASLREAARRSR